MKKQKLINLVNECISEVLSEIDLKNELRLKSYVDNALKKYGDADRSTVTTYCLKHATGITIKQLQDDATAHKWNEDTVKAIGFVLGHIKKKH